MRREADNAGLHLSVRELLNTMAGVQETVLLQLWTVGDEDHATLTWACPLEQLPPAVTDGRTPPESHTLMPLTAE